MPEAQPQLPEEVLQILVEVVVDSIELSQGIRNADLLVRSVEADRPFIAAHVVVGTVPNGYCSAELLT